MLWEATRGSNEKMTDKQHQLIEMRDKLYNGDAMRRGLACNEMLVDSRGLAN